MLPYRMSENLLLLLAWAKLLVRDYLWGRIHEDSRAVGRRRWIARLAIGDMLTF